MLGIGIAELVFIFLAVILLFGTKSLPDIARGFGKAMKMFRQEVSGLKEDFDLSAPSNSAARSSTKHDEKDA